MSEQRPEDIIAGKSRPFTGQEFLEGFANLFRIGEHSIARAGRVIGQHAVKTMVAQLGCGFRMRGEITFDVILRDFLEFVAAAVNIDNDNAHAIARAIFILAQLGVPP